jgi:hypothetical protein
MMDFSAKRDGTVFAISSSMAPPRPLPDDLESPEPMDSMDMDGRSSVRIAEECLELDTANPRDIRVLRSWMGRVNGAAYPQPYVVEESPGHFRLYVGDAAERVRTRHGIL